MKLEYGAVLEKIAYSRADLARTETIYPLAIVAIYTWVLSSGPPIKLLWVLAMCLPVAIATLGFVKILSRYQLMDLLETYCSRIEEHFYGSGDDWGWERFYRRNRALFRLRKTRESIAFVVLLGTIAFAVLSPTLFDMLSRQPTETARAHAPAR